MPYARFQDTGAEYTVTTTRRVDGVEVIKTVTKRETQEHCAQCNTVIPDRYEEIEVWINYDCEGVDSEIRAFCSYQCLSDWAQARKG